MIRILIQIYIWAIIIDAVVSYIPDLRNHPLVLQLRKVTDLSLKPIRKALPPDLAFDPSPIIVIVALNLLMALW